MATAVGSNYTLSFGALRRILDGETLNNVVLQIIRHTEIPGSNNTRFRMLLNDGVNLFPYAVLATQLNNLIFDKQLENFTIFKLKNYAFNQLPPNKKVIFCIDIEVIVPGCDVNCKINAGNVLGEASDLESESMSLPCVNPRFNNNPNPSTSGIAQNWDTERSSTSLLQHANDESAHVNPIASLNPYRRKWTIKARVSYKTPYIKYNDGTKQGKYFSFHLLDSSGEIKATAFNEIATRFYDTLEIFKIYFISGANVKRAQENSLVKNDFNLILENYSKIEPYKGLMSSVPMPSLNFQTIQQISSLSKGLPADVIGICHRVSDVSVVMSKSNKEVSKRVISLIDNLKKPIAVTLWGAYAENFPATGTHVVAIKNATVSNFGGFSLNTSYQSMIYIDPNINKTFELKSWFRTINPEMIITPVSPQKEASQNWNTLAEMFTEMNNSNGRLYYYTLKATIVTVKKEKCLYQGCPILGCRKKVTDLNNGLYKCERCTLNFDTFRWSLCLVFEVADFTGSHWVTAFRETAESLIDMGPDQLNEIKNESRDKYDDILYGLNLRTYLFRMKSYVETINDEKYIKTIVLSFCPVSPISFSKLLFGNIKRYHRILNGTS